MTTALASTYVPTETDKVLAEMLTENTGRHFLDSGGAYGRNWERNQGATAEAFHSAPSATLDRWACVTVDVFHYLRDRLEYDATLTAEFDAFAADSDSPWLADVEEWVDSLREAKRLADPCGRYGDDATPRTWNTYNGEDYLSQVIQGITFTLDDDREPCAIVQIHGGCDVRGGYTRPRVFRVTTYDGASYFPHDNANAEIYCTRDSVGPAVIVSTVDVDTSYGVTVEDVPVLEYVTECDFGISIYSGVDYVDRDGSSTDWRPDYDSARDLGYVPCPRCGAPLAASAPYAG
jgi:hypothetical protein